MKIKQIATLIKNAQNSLCCPKCQAAYTAERLEVVGLNSRCGIFSGFCSQCGTTMLVVLSWRDLCKTFVKHKGQVQKVLKKKILPADIVEMKNFLRTFDGDLAKILSRS